MSFIMYSELSAGLTEMGNSVSFSVNRGYWTHKTTEGIGGGVSYFKVFARDEPVEYYFGLEYNYTSNFIYFKPLNDGYLYKIYYNIHAVTFPWNFRVNFLRNYLSYDLGGFFDAPIKTMYQAEEEINFDPYKVVSFNIRGEEVFKKIGIGISTGFGFRFKPSQRKGFILNSGIRLTKKRFPDGIYLLDNYYYFHRLEYRF